MAALSLVSDLSQALKSSPLPTFLGSPVALQSYVQSRLDFLFTARPTAVNLGAATRRLSRVLNSGVGSGQGVEEIVQALIKEGKLVADEDVGRNKEMSRWGAEWLEREWNEGVRDGVRRGEGGLNVLTVCNTGSLATSVRRFESIHFS